MARHSFVQMSKLTAVSDRLDYISNPKRQEHLYAFYSTVQPEFWKYLSDQAQFDFWRSHQQNGKCIEARELIIALPESLQKYDPMQLLENFTEAFRQKYGVQCAAALHHNKSMTNYHIHLVFADRVILEKAEVKTAARNMFFDESGRHVRTKKEIQDAQGNVRPGCYILKKGEVYESKLFSARKEVFKSREFLQEAKQMYTELINQFVSEKEKLQVFDSAGPYLPTKKIGKNNPLAEVITKDNELRQEWNQTVDQVLIAGGSQEEVTEFKQSEVTERVSESIRDNGNDPGLFAQILRIAIEILKEFLDHLMRDREQESIKKEQERIEKERKSELKKSEFAKRTSDLELTNTELEVISLEAVHQKLNKCNRKLYALQKQQKTLQMMLDTIPDNLFHRKERKAAEERISGIQRQIESTRGHMAMIPKTYGFKDVKSAEAAYKEAKSKLRSLKEAQGDITDTITEKKPLTQNQNVSILKELARRRFEEQQEKEKYSGKNRGGKEKHELEL